MKKLKILCPKCKDKTYGHLFLSKNIHKGESTVICFNGNCDFSMNISEWNNKTKNNRL